MYRHVGIYRIEVIGQHVHVVVSGSVLQAQLCIHQRHRDGVVASVGMCGQLDIAVHLNLFWDKVDIFLGHECYQRRVVPFARGQFHIAFHYGCCPCLHHRCGSVQCECEFIHSNLCLVYSHAAVSRIFQAERQRAREVQLVGQARIAHREVHLLCIALQAQTILYLGYASTGCAHACIQAVFAVHERQGAGVNHDILVPADGAQLPRRGCGVLVGSILRQVHYVEVGLSVRCDVEVGFHVVQGKLADDDIAVYGLDDIHAQHHIRYGEQGVGLCTFHRVDDIQPLHFYAEVREGAEEGQVHLLQVMRAGEYRVRHLVDDRSESFGREYDIACQTHHE